MGRKSVAELQEELDDERADNERLFKKVEQLRDVIAELEGDDGEEDADADADDDAED